MPESEIVKAASWETARAGQGCPEPDCKGVLSLHSNPERGNKPGYFCLDCSEHPKEHRTQSIPGSASEFLLRHKKESGGFTLENP